MKAYTVAESTDQFCIAQGNDDRKYYDNMLYHSLQAWNDLLRTTLWAFQSVWVETRKDSSSRYPYITLPRNMDLFLALLEEDRCGRLVQLPGSSSFSTSFPPVQKSCGCTADCGCGDLCAAANSFSLITKPVVIGGTTYTEKQWLEVCANGDVIEYREVPSKTETGAVITVQNTQRICTLATKPCGCVEDTDANRVLLSDTCGCRLDTCHRSRIFRPEPSGCETTIQDDGCGRLQLIGKDIKPWYVLQYQESEGCDISLIPDYALFTHHAGIDFFSIAFNPRRRNERRDAKYFYEEQKLKLVEQLNPIDLEVVHKLQSQPRILP